MRYLQLPRMWMPDQDEMNSVRRYATKFWKKDNKKKILIRRVEDNKLSVLTNYLVTFAISRAAANTKTKGTTFNIIRSEKSEDKLDLQRYIKKN